MLVIAFPGSARALLPGSKPPKASCTRVRQASNGWLRATSAPTVDEGHALLADATLTVDLWAAGRRVPVTASEDFPGLHLVGWMPATALDVGLTRAITVVAGHVELGQGTYVDVRGVDGDQLAVRPLGALSTVEIVVECDAVALDVGVQQTQPLNKPWTRRSIATSGVSVHHAPGSPAFLVLGEGSASFWTLPPLASGWRRIRTAGPDVLDGWIEREGESDASPDPDVVVDGYQWKFDHGATHVVVRATKVHSTLGMHGWLDAGAQVHALGSAANRVRFLSTRMGLLPSTEDALWVDAKDLDPL